MSLNQRKCRIAIDGPSGAGKSTIAKRVAAALAIDYIDTGAMYRAVAYKIMKQGILPEQSHKLEEMLANTDVELSDGQIFLDGVVVGDEIRTPQVTMISSACSAIPMVREKLVSLQRKMGQTKSVVMDGRDIGTNVLTDAEYKFFLTASTGERATRRYKELLEKDEDITLEQVEADIIRRDQNDLTRALNPLRKAEDAVEIDSTAMSIDQVVAFILETVA